MKDINLTKVSTPGTFRWTLLHCVAITLLFGATAGRADRFPAGCGLPSGSGDGSHAIVAQSRSVVRAGQTVEYRVAVLNPTTDDFGDSACAITNVHVSLRLPSGLVVPIVTNLALNPGDPPVLCPGDSRCTTTYVGPAGFGYPYVVSSRDVTNITFSPECPFPPGPTPALIAQTDYGAQIRNSDAGFCAVSEAQCYPLLLDSAPPVAGDFNGDGIVDRNELSLVLSNYWAQNPICMTNPATLGDGKFQFALTNDNGWALTVQASSDGSNWTNLPGPAFPVYQFYDPDGTAAPVRFYRLKLQ